MSKVILKVNDLNLDQVSGSARETLRHASFFLPGGRITALMGLNYSGNELAAEALLGRVNLNWLENNIYVDGKRIRDAADLKGKVFLLSVKNPIIKTWSVAEYLCLPSSGWLLSRKAERKILREARDIFSGLKFELDVEKKMSELGELERRAVELARARQKNAKVLIVEDECEGMRADEITRYGELIRNAVSGETAVALLTHSQPVLAALADEYVIFRKGRVVKKCGKETLEETQLNQVLIGNTLIQKMKQLNSYERRNTEGHIPVYRVDRLRILGREHACQFNGGEIFSFVILDNAARRQAFLALSGRTPDPDAVYSVRGRVLTPRSLHDFLRCKVASVETMNGEDEILSHMSVGDNLMIPSVKKLTGIEFIRFSENLSQILSEDMGNEGAEADRLVNELSLNDRIQVSLERWYIFRPLVLLLMDPFAECDAYGESLIVSYIKKFVNIGTAVILFKSTIEHIETLSDRIVIL